MPPSLKPAADRLAVGVMTGTSMDGLDASLIRIHGRGLSMQTAILGHFAMPLGPLGDRLRRAASQEPLPAREFAAFGRDLALLHIEAIEKLIASVSIESLSFIAVHGQTIHHGPPCSWQWIEPALIAHRFRCPVVSNLRQADLAAGGQGAPITPLADWVLFRHPTERRAIVNLGGFCNITFLPPAQSDEAIHDIRGFDVCACNHVLDAVARLVLGAAFDADGRAAASGTANETLKAELIDLLRNQAAAGRSLGTGDETAAWVQRSLATLAPNDLAATAAAGVGEVIGKRISALGVDRAICAGGGTWNRALMQRISRSARTVTATSDDFGVPVAARESMAMAILGALSADGVPITLPQVTGCASPPPIAGSWCGFSPGA